MKKYVKAFTKGYIGGLKYGTNIILGITAIIIGVECMTKGSSELIKTLKIE